MSARDERPTLPPAPDECAEFEARLREVGEACARTENVCKIYAGLVTRGAEVIDHGVTDRCESP